MSVLTAAHRRTLDQIVQRARAVAEAAAKEVLSRLGAGRESKPAYLSEEDNRLRLALREKARLLGDSTQGDQADLPRLVADVGYEQWHRLLFARLLEVNRLLHHPDVPGVPLSMADCAELAAEEGELDGWSVAASYAERILPAVFRSDDPAVRLRFAPERRAELDALVAGLDREMLLAEDALGWVYQFWQTAEKKRVNESGRKIGGADLPPVTQLFTEDYMVRFLLENSLGAWWAARHPESPLLTGWDYLRRLDDGTPAAGTFVEWPSTAAEVTVMDPCCGSGHFLVAAFGMLWRMRAEEEDLDPAAAQDAVLRDNLFGLELDPRCTQIARFTLILETWKQGGYRKAPTPKVACSGVPVTADVATWEGQVADLNLVPAMRRLHSLFQHADTLGSLIDPSLAPDDALVSVHGTTGDVWVAVRSHVARLLAAETRSTSDALMQSTTADVLNAAEMLARRYTLVITNPPFLASNKLEELPGERVMRLTFGDQDLALAVVGRFLPRNPGCSIAVVTPAAWIYLKSFADVRTDLLQRSDWNVLATLGKRAFRSITGDVVQASLLIASGRGQSTRIRSALLDTTTRASIEEKSTALKTGEVQLVDRNQLVTSIHRIFGGTGGSELLSARASSWQGLVTMDTNRFVMTFWEVGGDDGSTWERYLTAPSTTDYWCGREHVLRWEKGKGALAASNAHNINPRTVLGQRGVLLGQSSLRATLYSGEMFNDACSPLIPHSERDIDALWSYISSNEYGPAVRRINAKVVVNPGYLVRVPFDREHWQRVADEAGPLPTPHSDDPTQWLFHGTITTATGHPLQVTLARLLGYRWPDQQPDELDALADTDGIVALPALAGELDAATRLRRLLEVAHGPGWSTRREQELITEACGKRIGLAEWLRDEFFKQHTRLFHQRPFLWHVWDGRKDGFAAIINYHRLDRKTLEKLTFTTLGGWIERQRAAVADDLAGADQRLTAAQDLQQRLQLILAGEPPYDLFVRWKSLAEQPLGWEPDLDDGVRLNLRPFVTAGVLRATVNVSWKKDRGANPDGTNPWGAERHNDLHVSVAERRAARTETERR